MPAKTAGKVELCDECRFDGGWHYEDGHPTRPHHDQAKQLEKARTLSAEANEKAFATAKDIFREFAEQRDEFSANHIRDLFDAAGIPDPINGAVFSWAAGSKCTPDGPLIENTGRREPSDEATTRHEIVIWRSRIHRARIAS